MKENKSGSTPPTKPLNWRRQKRKLVINSEISKFTKIFKENFITLIISALGLVSALSWNDAIKSAINTLFPAASDLIYKFYVAVIVTIISIVITYFISRLNQRKPY